ncbi:hypothetical protein OGAPHI_000773 [Ogataea philodendri]|uniref:Retrograde transport protein Dsl1 C-terminal domain-containing protein n=1 Tax=Ogataea philodendri TaxID=1378263 RepID=A0A9P8PFT5_9ASCO|nr:uncharacterized protein OGAPHI_000773 [Ogataea philodendri]KAH3671062.1 hypothetical protein OGAPHI_000773 [Ogataea philodendri]
MDSISSALHSYVREYDVAKLARDLRRNTVTPGVANVQYQAADYLQQLECCNLLWVIKGLLSELSGSTGEDIVFDSAVSNYRKASLKIKELETLVGGETAITTEIKQRIKEYQEDITGEMKTRLGKYLSLGPDKFEYSNKVNDMTFAEYLRWSYEFCQQSEQEFLQYFGLAKRFGAELGPKLGCSVDLKYDGEQIVLTFGEEVPFSKGLSGIENIINFFNLFMDHNRGTEKYHLGSIKLAVAKVLLGYLKKEMFGSQNVYSLILGKYGADESRSVGQLEVISALLGQDGWTRDGICDLEFWLDNLVNHWVETLVDQQIDKIKDLATSGGLEKLELEEFIEKTPESVGIVEKPLEPADDEWNSEWNEDWDEGPEPPVKEEEEDDDDDWDAWNEDWKDEKNDLGVKSIVSTSKSSSTVQVVKYSGVCGWMEDLVATYYQNYLELRSKAQSHSFEDVEDVFKASIKKLVVCFYMVASKSYTNWVSFYTDYSKIVDNVIAKYGVRMDTCVDLRNKVQLRRTQEYLESLFTVIHPHEAVLFHDNGFDNRLHKRHATELVAQLGDEFGRINKELVAGLAVNSLVVQEVSGSVATQICGYVSSMIISRDNIASDESQVLSELVAGLLKIVHVPELGDIHKLKNYQKLEQVKLLLDSGLRDILDSFYDARYFELATDELVGLVRSLFVDSPLRRSVIDEIEELRAS